MVRLRQMDMLELGGTTPQPQAEPKSNPETLATVSQIISDKITSAVSPSRHGGHTYKQI